MDGIQNNQQLSTENVVDDLAHTDEHGSFESNRRLPLCLEPFVLSSNMYQDDMVAALKGNASHGGRR
jgi:hypothetical protein